MWQGAGSASAVLLCTHDSQELSVWDIESFCNAFEGFVENCYGNLEHPAEGMSPEMTMAKGLVMFGAHKHEVEPYTRESSCGPFLQPPKHGYGRF
jgi:hypothetical protein